jgi:type I restriction enzyme S subunit
MTTVQTPLGELCRLITDGKHGDCKNQQDSGFYFLSAKDVRDGKLNYEDARQITETDFLDTHRRTQLEPDDLVISNSGTIGRMALVKNQPETSRTTFQKSVAIVKPKHERVLASWLYYFLHFDLERLIGFAGGTAQKNLLLRDLRAFSIALQPLPIQCKIAGVLSAYDDLIENNTRRIAILEAMAQAIYREWFVEFRFPGHEKIKFVDSTLGKIPEGWAATVGDFGKVTTGKTPTKTRPENFGGEIPFVKTPDMHGNLFCISTSEALSDEGVMSQPSQTVPPNSVCISCIGTVGAISITSATCQTNQQINTIIPHSLSGPFHK